MAHEEQDYIDGWLTYSNFIDDLRDDSDLITDLDEDDEFKEKLLACQTNLERFRLVWSNKELRDEVEKFYKRDLDDILEQASSMTGKSLLESKKMRELGNKSFKEGNYVQALNYYTQAIKYAPYPSQEQPDDAMALALANRSVALYSMTRYRLCLLDIDLAITYGYPEANLFKLLIRKVKCLHILSVWANDIEDIKNKLKQMMKAPGTKEFIKAEVSNMFEFLENSHPEEMAKEELDVEDETVHRLCNASKTLTQGADCVEMSYDNDKGRYLIINKDVSYGRLLLAEDPFVCNLAPSKRNQHCYHCFGRLHSCGLACEKCTQILYCSLECLRANFEIHSNECDRFLFFQRILGVAYLVAHIMFKVGFNPTSIPVYSKKSIENKALDDVLKMPASDWPDQVYKNDYASVLSLMDHASEYDYDSLMGYTLTAVYLTLAFKDQFPTKFPSDEHTQLVTGSLVLRHLFQLQTNLISILDQNLQNLVMVGHSLSGAQERPIGIGLYPTISLLNHSCSPNILSIFHKSKFIARASSSLECGAEINYCYGPSVSCMSKLDRQTRLKEQYFFECQCNCCVNDKENECRALVCPKCDGPVIYNRDLTHRCLNCCSENMLNVGDILKKVGDFKIELEDIEVTKSASIDNLLNIEKSLKKLVYWRNPMFVKIKSQLIEFAKRNDDHDKALEYCKEELDLADRTYGEGSLESIMIKLKYIDLDWHRLSEKFNHSNDTGDDKSTKESITQELKELLSTVQSTRGKLKELLNSTSVLGAESSFSQELKFLSETHANINKHITELENEGKVDDSNDQLKQESASIN